MGRRVRRVHRPHRTVMAFIGWVSVALLLTATAMGLALAVGVWATWLNL